MGLVSVVFWYLFFLVFLYVCHAHENGASVSADAWLVCICYVCLFCLRCRPVYYLFSMAIYCGKCAECLHTTFCCAVFGRYLFNTSIIIFLVDNTLVSAIGDAIIYLFCSK